LTNPVDIAASHERGAWRHYLRAVGPGLVTGASDDDPSAIATYASAGAQTGFGLLWTCVLTFPLMVAVQINSDRAALATGRTFGELVRSRFGRRGRRTFVLLLVVHLLANVLVTAADLVAVGAGLELVGAGPAWLWAGIAGGVVVMLLVRGSFSTIARVLKVLCVSLLGYVAVLFVVRIDWGQVAVRTFVPRFAVERSSLALLLAVLGATLPPYVFFWQNVHRLEELRAEGDTPGTIATLDARPPARARRKQRTSTMDVVVGTAFAVVVMFGVMVSLAVTSGDHGSREITQVTDAADALEPVAGSLAKVLFAVGFVAAGLLAVPVLAGTGAANLAGILGREWGFSRAVHQAPEFYGLVVAATVAGCVLAVAGVDPIRLLVIAATINGFTSAPLLAIVMFVSGDRALLGDHKASLPLRVLGWTAVVLMAVTAVAVVAMSLADVV
jgi:NRAMP (natural resistance-associated macrophage protein)-like metal ion transporter